MFLSQKVVTSPRWQPLLRAHSLDTVGGVYRFTGGDVVTRSGSTEVRKITFFEEGETRILYLKKYWAARLSQLWSGCLRGTFFGCSKVRREFENLRRLHGCGLDAPQPAAYGEERRARWLVRSFLISEGVPAPMRLDTFIRDYLPALPESERRRTRRELIDRLAAYTRRLHENRFVHHDYYWRNIILTGQSLASFSPIDTPKGRFWVPWRAEQGRAKDLATLDAPAPRFFRVAERLRFFLRYVGGTTLTGENKRLIRRVLRLAEPMRDEQLRRVQKSRPVVS